MIYTIAIDWLAISCIYMGADEWCPRDTDAFSYKMESFGTRQFSRFYRARRPNEENGIDEFAEVQATPYSPVIPAYVVIVRFVNRFLYHPNFWELAAQFLQENQFEINSISRIDICADFNQFATIDPKTLIEYFAAKRLRHIGRGVGSLYFNHGVGVEFDEFGKPTKDYGVNYTGLSFGTHSSDAHVYLYNKSFELATQGDKPWIKDTWRAAGLDMHNVWRLEVTIKAGGLKFRDKKSGSQVHVDVPMVKDVECLDKIYMTFVRKLFSFVKNHKEIKNISREPRIVLFDESRPAYDRGAFSNLSPGNRMERILIKTLYQFTDRYRVLNIYNAEEHAMRLADSLAHATGLDEWLYEKSQLWDKQIHK